MGRSTVHVLKQRTTAVPAVVPQAKSSLIRRLVAAEDDPARRRIRAWLADLDDRQLAGFGFVPEDIAILRGTRTLRSR